MRMVRYVFFPGSLRLDVVVSCVLRLVRYPRNGVWVDDTLE